MLSPLLIIEHISHILIMILIIHELEPFPLDLDCSLFLSCQNLCWIQKLLGIMVLLLRQQADGDIVFDEPLVDSLQV